MRVLSPPCLVIRPGKNITSEWGWKPPDFKRVRFQVECMDGTGFVWHCLVMFENWVHRRAGHVPFRLPFFFLYFFLFKNFLRP